MKIASIFIIAFLCINQSWAGKEFICGVSMSEEIMKAGIENDIQGFGFYEPPRTTRNSGSGSHGSKGKLAGNYNIAIFINAADFYTNISRGTLRSYLGPGGKVAQIYGEVNSRLRYVAYLSNFSEVLHTATWSFAFFDPRPIKESIERRYFVVSKCSMNNYTENTPNQDEAERIERSVTAEQIRDERNAVLNKTLNYRIHNIDVSSITQDNSNSPFIKKDFDNIYDFTNEPDWFKEYEGKNTICNDPGQYAGLIATGLTLGAGITVCAFKYLVDTGYFNK